MMTMPQKKFFLSLTDLEAKPSTILAEYWKYELHTVSCLNSTCLRNIFKSELRDHKFDSVKKPSRKKELWGKTTVKAQFLCIFLVYIKNRTELHWENEIVLVIQTKWSLFLVKGVSILPECLLNKLQYTIPSDLCNSCNDVYAIHVL